MKLDEIKSDVEKVVPNANLTVSIEGLAWLFFKDARTPWKAWFPNAAKHELRMKITRDLGNSTNIKTELVIPINNELEIKPLTATTVSGMDGNFNTKILNVNSLHPQVKFDMAGLPHNSIPLKIHNAIMCPAGDEFDVEILSLDTQEMNPMNNRKWNGERERIAPAVKAGITMSPNTITEINLSGTKIYELPSNNGALQLKHSVEISNHCGKDLNCDHNSDFHHYYMLMNKNNLRMRYAVLTGVKYDVGPLSKSLLAPCNVIYSDDDPQYP